MTFQQTNVHIVSGIRFLILNVTAPLHNYIIEVPFFNVISRGKSYSFTY
jgi:hypothetical protein